MRTKKRSKVELFLDSGAFSAFTQGVKIDIQEYIAFIKEHQEHLTVYANLDVIGDADATLKNQKIMEKAGLLPLPCFHRKEDFKYLQHYVDNYDYIALGGVAQTKNRNELAAWLDRCFSEFICDKKGMPKVRVHGFGVTGWKILQRYPWYSVDSTSWVISSRVGSVYIPRHRNSEWIYSEPPWKIFVSNRAPSKSKAGVHIDTLSPKHREMMLNYCKAKGFQLGKSMFKVVKITHELEDDERWAGPNKDGKREVEVVVENGLSNNYKHRDQLNILYFLDLEKSIPKWPWAFKHVNSGMGFDLM